MVLKYLWRCAVANQKRSCYGISRGSCSIALYTWKARSISCRISFMNVHTYKIWVCLWACVWVCVCVRVLVCVRVCKHACISEIINKIYINKYSNSYAHLKLGPLQAYTWILHICKSILCAEFADAIIV